MQIKVLRESALAALLVVLAVPMPTSAQATSLNISIKDQRLVVAYQTPDGVFFGSGTLRSPYQIVSLDALQFGSDAPIQNQGSLVGNNGDRDALGIHLRGDIVGLNQREHLVGIKRNGQGTGATGEGQGTGTTGEGQGTGTTGEGQGTGTTGEGQGTGATGEGQGTGATGEGSSSGITGAGDSALIPAWGYAEVLLGCGRADVIIYNDTERGLEEALVATVTVDYCARP